MLLSGNRRLKNSIAASRDRLYRLAFSWCHDPHIADDLVQDAIEKALSKTHQLRAAKAVDCWLYSVLSNCYKDHLRRRKRELERHVSEEDFAVDDEGSRPDSMLAHREVYRAMARLTEDQRVILSLVELAGLSYAEVSETLSIPLGTVMSRLSRARKELRESLLAEETGTRANVTYLIHR